MKAPVKTIIEKQLISRVHCIIYWHENAQSINKLTNTPFDFAQGKNKSNKLEVSNAAGGEAERLVGAVHVAAPTGEAQVPAVRGSGLRTTPVGAG